MVFWLIIFAIGFYLMSSFLPGTPFLGFCIGNGIPVLFGFSKIGANQNNIQDYFSSNSKYVNEYIKEVLVSEDNE